MFRTTVSLLTGCALAALSVTTAIAQDQARSFRGEEAQVFQGTRGAPLTLPSQAAPAAVVAEFLRGEGLSDETVASLVVESEYTAGQSGLTHLRLRQQVQGLDVVGAYAKATVDAEGGLVHLIEALAPAGGSLLQATIDPRQALDAALDAVHPGLQAAFGAPRRSGNSVAFGGDDYFHRDPTVTRVAIAMESGVLQEGFLVETWTEDDNLLHHTLVGGNGRVLDVQLRTNNDSYKIFPDHPGNSTQTKTNGPGAGNAESPAGWLFSGDQRSIDIAGNNVNAYLDRNNNNGADTGGATISDGNFVATAALGSSPTTGTNQDVAVQNLFYLNNIIHDKLYSHGFVEAMYNFQENNFGKGGSPGDSVNAEAQDGGGTNNANFATPLEGSSPRMQMYLWTYSSPNRDGDLDSDIVYHEYCHGLTWRMIGNMDGPVSGAIGEGMSDACSILMNDNDVVGEYSYNKAGGIRSEPYSSYSRTYGDFVGEVHDDGEIYAAIIWNLRTRYDDNGISRDRLWDDIVGGMNYTVTGPAFEDMRDGILAQSDDEARDCLIWEAFAQFGVGVNAHYSEKRLGPFAYKYSITEDKTLPSECDSGGGDPVGEVLSVNALKVKGVNHADLTWTDSLSEAVDVYRDGKNVGSNTDGDRAYRDNTGEKGGGTAMYQVCDGTTCSAEVQAIW